MRARTIAGMRVQYIQKKITKLHSTSAIAGASMGAAGCMAGSVGKVPHSGAPGRRGPWRDPPRDDDECAGPRPVVRCRRRAARRPYSNPLAKMPPATADTVLESLALLAPPEPPLPLSPTCTPSVAAAVAFAARVNLSVPPAMQALRLCSGPVRVRAVLVPPELTLAQLGAETLPLVTVNVAVREEDPASTSPRLIAPSDTAVSSVTAIEAGADTVGASFTAAMTMSTTPFPLRAPPEPLLPLSFTPTVSATLPFWFAAPR